MVKRKKTTRFLKNRNWKSKIANRLKGSAEDVCQDYLYGAIDPNRPIHVFNGPRKWLVKFLDAKRNGEDLLKDKFFMKKQNS